MGNIKGVIFDLDGTLIDSLETYLMAFNHTVDRYNLKTIDLREMTDFLNQFLSLEQLLLKLYPSLTPEDIQGFMVEMRDEFISLAKHHITLKPHTKEVLLSLKDRGMKIGIATGRMSQGNGKWRELNNLSIDILIDVVVTAGETKPKPDPACIIKCAEKLGIPLEKCVFVGDSKADIIAGRSAGVQVIALPTGVATRDELLKEMPGFLLDCLSELPAQIEKISQGNNSISKGST
jgi:HAD superfamily hydrolase (TIGR01509 family)